MRPSTTICYFFQCPLHPCSHTDPPLVQGGMLPQPDAVQSHWTP